MSSRSASRNVLPVSWEYSATSPVASARPATIISISVEELFGRYSYNLSPRSLHPVPDPGGRLLLLYGDNGKGKTTILNLMFHLLSAGEAKGHRSYIARVPFKSFSVSLGNGITVAANRTDPHLTGDFVINVIESNKVLESFIMEVDETGAVPSRSRASREQNERLDALSRSLSELGINPYYLTDSREFLNDSFVEDDARVIDRMVSIKRVERYFHDIGNLEDDGRGLLAFERDLDSRAARQATELIDAIGRFENWLRSQNYRGTSSGSATANAIYLDVIKRIAESSEPLEHGITPSDISSLRQRLRDVEQRSSEYAVFGLGTSFSAGDFLAALQNASPNQAHLMRGILGPHLESIEARLNALQGVYDILVRTTRAIRSFLNQKEIRIHVDEGISIVTHDGMRLHPTALSSGEKQLLMLLFSTLAARDLSRLFIIDEPEISLNVKWQRELLTTLLDCSAGTDMQFVMATHSIELISAFRGSVVQLDGDDA